MGGGIGGRWDWREVGGGFSNGVLYGLVPQAGGRWEVENPVTQRFHDGCQLCFMSCISCSKMTISR